MYPPGSSEAQSAQHQGRSNPAVNREEFHSGEHLSQQKRIQKKNTRCPNIELSGKANRTRNWRRSNIYFQWTINLATLPLKQVPHRKMGTPSSLVCCVRHTMPCVCVSVSVFDNVCPEKIRIHKKTAFFLCTILYLNMNWGIMKTSSLSLQLTFLKTRLGWSKKKIKNDKM